MSKETRGRMAYHVGLSAEAQVADTYRRLGYRCAATRWRGKGGEIDLIFEDGDAIVCVEVKKARAFDDAALRITPRQQLRICAAAEEYASTLPTGSLTPMRFDAALVNARGEIRIMENAICA